MNPEGTHSTGSVLHIDERRSAFNYHWIHDSSVAVLKIIWELRKCPSVPDALLPTLF